MSWLWTIQILFDVIALGGLCFLGVLRRNSAGERGSVDYTLMEDWKTRMDQWETQMNQQKKRMDKQFEVLSRICQKADQVVKEAQTWQLSFGTEEEKELRALADRPGSAKKGESIPTLEEVESTKARLSRETAPDLRAVLNGQLA